MRWGLFAHLGQHGGFTRAIEHRLAAIPFAQRHLVADGIARDDAIQQRLQRGRAASGGDRTAHQGDTGQQRRQRMRKGRGSGCGHHDSPKTVCNRGEGCTDRADILPQSSGHAMTQRVVVSRPGHRVSNNKARNMVRVTIDHDIDAVGASSISGTGVWIETERRCCCRRSRRSHTLTGMCVDRNTPCAITAPITFCRAVTRMLV